MPTPFPGSSFGQPSTLDLAIDDLDAAYFVALSTGLTPVDSQIGTPLIPTVCAAATADELIALDNFKLQVSDKRTECAFLDGLIAEECSEDETLLGQILANSEGSR